MVARQDLILAGSAFAKAAFHIIDPSILFTQKAQEGKYYQKGEIILEMKGNSASILSAERVALNFVGHLSGIATKTHHYASKIQDSSAKVTCTRKTLPLLRMPQKYAVRVGGGYNHRQGLDDMILIKDNHIEAVGNIEKAVQMARKAIGHSIKIEVECDYLDQVEEALKAKADIIMLDNMPISDILQAVSLSKGRAILEASGGITLKTISEVAKTGVNYISVGALTHSAPYADIALDIPT